MNSTEVVHYKVIGGEHTWPNSAFTIGITNRDFDASKVIWAFFNKHQKVNTVGTKEIEVPELVSFINDIANNRLLLQNLELNSNLIYEIYDINGKKIGGGKQFSDNKTIIDTQSYPVGMYVIRVNEVNTKNVNSFKSVVR